MCHLKPGQEVKSLSCILKEGLDPSASAARIHKSTGLILWAPEGGLSNFLPIWKYCCYNGKGQENTEKNPRQITYSPYWLQVCTIQSCILKDLESSQSWGTALLQVHLQGFVYCYVQGGDEMSFKICMFKEATACTSIKRKGLLCASWCWTLMQNDHQSKFQALVNLPLTVLIGRCYTIPNQNALISSVKVNMSSWINSIKPSTASCVSDKKLIKSWLSEAQVL